MLTAPESLSTVQQLMTSYRFDLKELLGDEGYEGWVNFPLPRTDDFGVSRHSTLWAIENVICGADSTTLRRASDAGWMDQIVYWRRGRMDSKNVQKALLSVYRDGIRLPGLGLRDGWMKNIRIGRMLPFPQSRINLKFSRLPSPNISRTALDSSFETWAIPIWNAIKAHLAATEI